MKPYNISPEESLTLRDVEALTNNGNDVTLSPHIGNIWRANMAVTDLGVKVVVYEGNCNGRDVDEYPGHLRMDNKFIPLVDETRPIMSTHLKFKPDMDVPYLSRQGLGSTPAQVHYNAMRRIFPEKQITLAAEYLYTSDPEIRDMLVYLVNHHHAFNRKLNLDGTVEVVELWNQESPKLVDDFMRLKNAQIQAVLKGTPPDIEGPLASNQLNIMMLGIKAFLEKRQRGAISKGEGKKFTAYAVSGRSMIHYTKNPKFQQEICAMYSILRERFSYLPEEIDVKMLPGSNLGFATAANEEPLELIRLIGRQNSRISETQEEIKSLSGDSQKTVISVVNGLRKELNDMIDQMWAIEPWETFYSQHDAICNGGKTIIPEEIKGMSFKKLGILIKPK